MLTLHVQSRDRHLCSISLMIHHTKNMLPYLQFHKKNSLLLPKGSDLRYYLFRIVEKILVFLERYSCWYASGLQEWYSTLQQLVDLFSTKQQQIKLWESRHRFKYMGQKPHHSFAKNAKKLVSFQRAQISYIVIILVFFGFTTLIFNSATVGWPILCKVVWIERYIWINRSKNQTFYFYVFSGV